jgi:hypothetical protein
MPLVSPSKLIGRLHGDELIPISMARYAITIFVASGQSTGRCQVSMMHEISLKTNGLCAYPSFWPPAIFSLSPIPRLRRGSRFEPSRLVPERSSTFRSARANRIVTSIDALIGEMRTRTHGAESMVWSMFIVSKEEELRYQ